MEEIKVKNHRLPVTALKFHGDNLLLAGEGSSLAIFDVLTNERLLSHKIFSSSVIHGIRNTREEDSPAVCLFGGKCFRILELRGSDIEQIWEEIELHDWIQDIRWLTDEISWKFGVALSHNFVILYDFDQRRILHEVHCEDKCILYSGLLLGDSWQDLVLAAGTVFNQVVIWAVEGQRSTTGQAKVIHRLEGHQGVIFSMDFNLDKKILCSVSDDRSLRLWQMVLTPGVNDEKQLDWENAKFEPLQQLYGHAARVWDCKLLEDYIISVGEDACCILWDYNGTLLKKFKGHKGKSIWSLAVHPSGKLATGGGDCGIRLYNFHGHHQEDSKVISRSLVPPEVTQGQTFFPRTVKLLDCDNLLIMTDEGILYKHNTLANQWSVLLQSEMYKSYCVLEVLQSRKLIALGSVHGEVVIFSGDLMTEFKIFEGKVHSCCWLETSSSNLFVIFSGPNGYMKLYKVEITEDVILEPDSTYQLPHAKQCWTTCALLLEDAELLLCGDRSGSVHVFKLNELEPTQKFAKIHGRAGVTDICLSDGKIYSGGRDGQIKEFNVNDDGQVELLHSNKVLKGLQWIAKLNFTEKDQLVLGFHTNNFVVYSLLQQQVVIKVACGGGNRSWDCGFAADNQMALYYIKSRDVICCQATVEENVTIIQPSLHGREVTSVATIFSGDDPIFTSGSEDTTVNILQLDSNNGNFKNLHTLTTHISSVRTICVLNSTAKSKFDESKLMFTAGGRAQMIAWRITKEAISCGANNGSVEIVSNNSASVQYEHLKTFSLVHKRRNKKSNLDPETRIMSVTAFSLQEIVECESQLCLVACGCSDGFLRVYLFDEKKPSFLLVFQSDFHDHCLLRVGHVILGPANHRSAYIYSSATDGRLILWDVRRIISVLEKAARKKLDIEDIIEMEQEENGVEFVSLSLSLTLHQSGINAVAIRKLSESEILLATAGDDNCLSVTKLKNEENGNFETVWILKELNAHATEITGVRFFSDYSVITASIDQRVTLWNVNEDLQKIKFRASRFVNVADISDLELLSRNSEDLFIVSGQGLQTFTVTSSL